ncbi:hypothetical protein PGQ11_012239 [Apiospora arundinis]|uniref:Bacteriophage T5 Orf172 DNA-binding domain-containing protein n=1 Tax=Apiospora arundinis TaxID=335852 RepID=A0ABR2I1S3_9PEZI
MENKPNTPPKNSTALPTPPKTRSSLKKTVRLSEGEPCPQSTSPSARPNKPVRGPDRRSVTAPLPGLARTGGFSSHAVQPINLNTGVSDSIIVATDTEMDPPSPSPLPRPSLQTASASAPELASTNPAAGGPGTRQPARPSVPQHLSSERTIHLTDSPASLDDKIKGVMRAQLPKKQLKQREHGNNYLFEVVPAQDPEKTIWKIGFTNGPAYKRQKVIFKICQHNSIRNQYDPGHVPIRLCRRAEGLTHAELSWYRYHFTCMCDVNNHREYFDVDPEVALEVIHRWRTFCMREPYTAKGKLQPFWEDRLRNMDRQQSLRADILDMAQRRKQWDRFVHATLLDALWYDLSVSLKKLQDRNIWRTTAVIEFLTIAFLLLPLPRMFTLPYYAMVIWVIAMINEIKLSATLNALSWPPTEDLKRSHLPLQATTGEAVQAEEESREIPSTESEMLPNDLGHMFDLPLEDDVF